MSHAHLFKAGDVVAVLLPLPLHSCYDYMVPEEFSVQEGDFVRVPLGRRDVCGVVWKAGEGNTPRAKIKAIIARLDVAPMKKPLRRLIDWMAWYTLAMPGTILKMAMSVPEALEPPPLLTGFGAGKTLDEAGLKETPGRQRVWRVVTEGKVLTATDLAREAAVSPAVVRSLVQAGVLHPVPLSKKTAFPRPQWQKPGPLLSDTQQEAAVRLQTKIGAGFSATLLEGITGSGKTEVYFEAIATALAHDRQVLILLPEIALGAQWLDRFRQRFDALPQQWHSELTPASRRATWRAIAEKEARVVVGARSALFLPFQDLGLIIIDEEHDASFKQEEGVIYHARDMAVVRARFEDCPIVLASATPSLETVVNVRQGKYQGLYLPDRHGVAELPDLHLVDMRAYSRNSGPTQRGRLSPQEKQEKGEQTNKKTSERFWLAPPLAEAITQTLEKNEQILLFLNRRGYAPLTLCNTCGYRMCCTNCTSWLVEHRSIGRLVCHHCGYSTPIPTACPQCETPHSFTACGPGIERLAEEVATRFPECRTVTLASDMAGGANAMRAAIAAMEAGDIDMMIGTQIIAKGYHFPRLTLVGIVDADLGLSGGDLRAAERTYQLLSQVAGRAGRAEHPGRVYLQSYTPEHPVLRAQIDGDFQSFIEEESRQREALSMPPFGRLAALIVSSEHDSRVQSFCQMLARCAPRHNGLEILGPVPAPLSYLRKRYRYRFLIKGARQTALQPLIRHWLSQAPTDPHVRVQVDIDPYSFL